MNLLECPYCKKQAAKLWEILVFPSPFWLSKSCRQCNNKIHFDFNTIKLIACSLFLGIILGNVIDRAFSINWAMFDVGFMIFFAFLPFFLGKKLFLKKTDKAQTMNK